MELNDTSKIVKQTQQTPQQPSRRESEGAASSFLGSGLDLESAMNFSLPSDGLPDLSLASNLSLNTPPLRGAQARVPEKEQEKDNTSKDKEQDKDKDQ